MLTILLHSSKTMRPAAQAASDYQAPALLRQANQLAEYLRSRSPVQLQSQMQLSPAKAAQTFELLQSWTDDPSLQRPAIDAFLGDIYSGLQVQSFTDEDRSYANEHLVILSGLYGGLRALDSIFPYRLEMGYKLPDFEPQSLYAFWGTDIAGLVPSDSTVINLSAVEYTKAVLPHIKNPVITPKFMTISAKTGEPTFVTVHAKIARGAFAHWLIERRIEHPDELRRFNELGYEFDESRSTPEQPVFVCEMFDGLGLSVRLS